MKGYDEVNPWPVMGLWIFHLCTYKPIRYDMIRHGTIQYDLPRDPDEGLEVGNDGMIEDKRQNKMGPRTACRTRLSRISCIYL